MRKETEENKTKQKKQQPSFLVACAALLKSMTKNLNMLKSSPAPNAQHRVRQPFEASLGFKQQIHPGFPFF